MADITNQIVTKDFYEKTINIIAQNTSFGYSTIALKGINQDLIKEFKFLKGIHIKGRSVEVNRTINNIEKNELRNLFRKVINLVGPNYLKILLAQKLNPKSLIYLENLGIKFG